MTTGDGRDGKRRTTLAQTALVLLEDWGLAPLREENRRDLVALLDDREDRRATGVTSQLPGNHGQEAIGEPTLADAMRDRLVHHADKIPLQGASMRQR
jgi:DNA replication protein DnaC